MGSKKRSFPVVVSLLILAAIGVYFLNLHNPKFIYWFVLRPPFDPDSLQSYVTLFSYVLGHGSDRHLAGNMFLLLIFGIYLEQNFGSRRALAIALAATIVIAAGYLLLPSSGGMWGASGIVSAYIAASSARFPRSLFAIVALFYAVYMGLAELASMILAPSPTVAHGAHVLGFIVGFIAAYLIRRAERNDPAP